MKSLDNILRKKLTRAEFLKLIGLAAISTVGLANIASHLLRPSDKGSQNSDAAQVQHGFGSRRFGE